MQPLRDLVSCPQLKAKTAEKCSLPAFWGGEDETVW